MEKLLKKDAKFEWNDECHQSLDTLKQKMVTMSIFVFPNWEKEFHFHVDVSSVTLGIILEKPGEGAIDHKITFASRKLSTTERNYKKA